MPSATSLDQLTPAGRGWYSVRHSSPNEMHRSPQSLSSGTMHSSAPTAGFIPVPANPQREGRSTNFAPGGCTGQISWGQLGGHFLAVNVLDEVHKDSPVGSPPPPVPSEGSRSKKIMPRFEGGKPSGGGPFPKQ